MLVPEADDLVGRWRRDWDPSAAAGVPAHVTVLYPFVEAETIDSGVRAELADLFAGHEPFEFALTEVRRFVPDVVYLAPEPAAPFRALTHAVVERWPDHPPYGGAYEQVVPHLTVAHTSDAARTDALAAEVAIGTEMARPLRLRCDKVALLVESAGMWHQEAEFGLG